MNEPIDRRDSRESDQREQEEPRVVVRDKRRIDPESGAVRPVAAAPPKAVDPTFGGPPGVSDSGQEAAADAPGGDWATGPGLQATLDERTGDLQRLKAEFDNYRKRVERDRVAVAGQVQGALLSQFVPVLDDIDRARSHGEVTGGFKVVADALDATVAKLGLERFGAEGDAFDPAVHEAVMHSESPDVEGPTCVSVMRSGYRLRERLLRPAMVAVAEPPAAASVERVEPADSEAFEDASVAEDAAPKT